MGDCSDIDHVTNAFSSTLLSDGWLFKEESDESENPWMPVKRVPSTVHQDLVDNKKLSDPFFDFNELKAEWVGTKSWTYKTQLIIPRIPPHSRVVLAFDGLDTFAYVKLNQRQILYSENMFLPHRVDITDAVADSDHHELEINFEPALLKAREIKANYPDHKFICFNGEEARLAVRKAQYHWGWDWGPLLMCAGIWRPIRLEVYTGRIVDIEIGMDFSNQYQRAWITVVSQLEGCESLDIIARITIRHQGDQIESRLVDVYDSNAVRAMFQLAHPRLWMPNGYGEQHLYTVEVAIVTRDTGDVLHSDTRRIGLREVELVQIPDKHGKSFYFRVNGVDVFCGGSCWIPADSFLTNITAEKYRAWIMLMASGNQKMIRVWGGGVYEDDAFYDACDELGVLVWQDFMFGCGNYPTFPAILESIEAEATANVKRIRHHPSLAIFAGNNEDYQVQEQTGLRYDYADKNEQHWLMTDFPARYIYESILPRVVRSYAPSIPYHPGSPWGDGKPTSDPTVGDLHQWNVWHGTQEKYQIFDTLGGRFNSEFGMEAFPSLTTIKSFIADENELYPQSRTIDFHNKAAGHERRIATYLVENVRTATELETYTYLTQLIQFEALAFGYRGWRKQWGDGRKCGGALVWQLNDCWPVVSWSICDYYLRRKPAYYAVARAMAPLAIGIRRAHYDWSVAHARAPKTLVWEAWTVSSRIDATSIADIEIKFLSVKTGQEVREKLIFHHVEIKPNGTTNITSGVIDNIGEEPYILAARMFIGGCVIARDTDWPQPLKYLQFPARNLTVKPTHIGFEVSSDRPVKCVVFEEQDGCHLSDNAFDVIPGDTRSIVAKGYSMHEGLPKWSYLGQNEQ